MYTDNQILEPTCVSNGRVGLCHRFQPPPPVLVALVLLPCQQVSHTYRTSCSMKGFDSVVSAARMLGSLLRRLAQILPRTTGETSDPLIVDHLARLAPAFMAAPQHDVKLMDWTLRWSQEGRRKRMPTMQGTPECAVAQAWTY
jgi:hypothetical protein